jgi:hypothetical protein
MPLFGARLAQERLCSVATTYGFCKIALYQNKPIRNFTTLSISFVYDEKRSNKHCHCLSEIGQP